MYIIALDRSVGADQPQRHPQRHLMFQSLSKPEVHKQTQNYQIIETLHF